jgi:hypothetical protein
VPRTAAAALDADVVKPLAAWLASYDSAKVQQGLEEAGTAAASPALFSLTAARTPPVTSGMRYPYPSSSKPKRQECLSVLQHRRLEYDAARRRLEAAARTAGAHPTDAQAERQLGRTEAESERAFGREGGWSWVVSLPIPWQTNSRGRGAAGTRQLGAVLLVQH